MTISTVRLYCSTLWKILFSYLSNIHSSLWTSLNPTHMWGPHIKKYPKDIVLHDLEAKSITDMRESCLNEMLSMLLDHGHKQILNTFNGTATPMPQLWAHDWDV